MAEETTFDGIVLAAVAWEVSNTNWQVDRCAQLFQVILEQVSVGGIAAAAIAQQ